MSGHKNLDFIVKDIVSTVDINDNAVDYNNNIVNNKKYFDDYIKDNIVEVNNDKTKSQYITVDYLDTRFSKMFKIIQNMAGQSREQENYKSDKNYKSFKTKNIDFVGTSQLKSVDKILEPVNKII